jgi:hypothetical protein
MMADDSTDSRPAQSPETQLGPGGESEPADGGASPANGSEDHADVPGAGDTGPDAGSPGGMGGVRARGGTGTDRPPGGLSPMSYDRAADEE